MNREQIFRSILAGESLLPFDLNSFPADSIEHRLLSEHRSRFQKIFNAINSVPGTAIPPIYFDLNNSTQVDAFATIAKNLPYISVNYGLILIIYDTFYRMLSCPSVLRHIGDVVVEDVHRCVFYPVCNDYSLLGSTKFGLASIQPLDPYRLFHAERLASISVDFFMTHEIAHVRNGHFGYLISQSLLPFIGESSSLAAMRVGVPMMTRQALEMDADVFALTSTVRNYLQTASENDLILRGHFEATADLSLPPHVILSGRQALHSDCLFSFLTAWRVAGLDFDLMSFNLGDHPPAFLRSISPMRFIDMQIHENVKDKEKYKRDVIDHAIYHSSHSLAVISGEDEAFLTKMDDPASFASLYQHLSAIDNEWKRIAFDSSAFAYFDTTDWESRLRSEGLFPTN